MLSIVEEGPTMDQQPPTDDAFALLVADVFDAAGVLRRYGEQIAASAGQTQARWQLMSVVSSGDWTVPMAAERLGTSRQAVQRIANELAGERLAVFADNPRHRNSPFLHLTSKGRRLHAAIAHEATRRHTTLAEDLRGTDLVKLRAMLRRITQVVRAEADDPNHREQTHH
jgi:DNA-binding MarR family transcriptional regulator